MDVVLFQPEIPPNTGNSIRLCANVGARLHLVEPLGFSLEDRQLKRAGLDYHDLTHVKIHPDWATCRRSFQDHQRLFVFSTAGSRRYDLVDWRLDDVIIFGQETAGLPPYVLQDFDEEHRVYLPMRPDNRSVNLSNTVAIACYEIWRQHHFRLE